ncbi:hypothetical protein KC363_g296 [Hortaea werneckii]|nr:hypothetical protein KC361_g3732 [Hortaea werneckii]KAI7197367.1 hypothetical protein KC363_g296 [Hortaea werneckii]
MPPTPPKTQISPPGPITIRPRRHPEDLLPLTHLLQTVYERDAYPVQGTADAAGFLTQASTLRAWVAETTPCSSSSSSSSGQTGEVGEAVEDGAEARERAREDIRGKAPGQIVGHVAVSRPREEDVAVRLWRALHPPQRRGWTAAGQEEKEKEKEEEEEEEEKEEEEEIAVLERLFIHPSARGEGLASSLLRTAEGWAARATSSSPLDNPFEEEHEVEKVDYDPPQQQQQQEKKKREKKTKTKGLRLLLFALTKDEAAMRLYRRRGWAEFGRTGFIWDDDEGLSVHGGSEGVQWVEGVEGEDKRRRMRRKEKEMEAICFVSPARPVEVDG